MATSSAGGASVETAEGTSSHEAHDSSSEGTTRVVSLLHRLRAPKPSEFSRKRGIDRKPPTEGKEASSRERFEVGV